MTDIKGRLAKDWSPPPWWHTPEQQLTRAHTLWPSAVLPGSLKRFKPVTLSEVPLLHVPNPFDSLWDKVVDPEGYTKTWWRDCWEGGMRLAPNTHEHMQPVWLAFDPEYGKGIQSDLLWGQFNLAASEVFSALVQFPDWSKSWNDGAPAPQLSGYQLRLGNDWSHVPYLDRMNGAQWNDDSLLVLRGRWAGAGSHKRSSPSVREC